MNAFFWPYRPPNMKRLLLLIVLAVVGPFSWVNERIWLARRNPHATCRECQPTASAYSTPPAHPNKEVG
jgi:hypothetical protein